MAEHASLFDPPREQSFATVQPWRPRALSHAEWPPDYRRVWAWRIETLAKLRANPNALASARVYYRTRKSEFIQHWMDTYNPRKQGIKWLPFVFFQRQEDFITYLQELDRDAECGVVPKCRDVGATWLACAYTVACYILERDDATGWGSRKEDLIDKLGDTDSIFEKMRLIIDRLPDIWLPAGFKPRDHATRMKLINPANGSSVTGEAGDNIGRGGRKTRYFVDESAHIERPERVEAALGDNTNVRIDISSVNGLGNIFQRRDANAVEWVRDGKYERGMVRRFVFDWRDHPEKTQEWYDRRKIKAEREGMQHIFAQEVDRNYSAAVQNTIISSEWIHAAIDAHLLIPCLRVNPPNAWMAGLDVADQGMDRNALAVRQWVILRNVEEWGERDAGISTRRMLTTLRPHKAIKVQYDSIGVGVGVKVEYNRLVDDGIITRSDCNLIPWNAGGAVVNPYSRTIPDDDQSLLNRDFFKNMKAQAWWSLRTRFYKTWRMVTAIKNNETVPDYDPGELISLDGSMELLHTVCKELAQPVRGESTDLRMVVNKAPEGTKSPNTADAVVMAFFPAPEANGQAYVGDYSG